MYKIVVLEDEPSQARRMAEFLRKYESSLANVSFSVEHYSNGLALLNAYSCDADVVFLDICVPDMQGMDVARAIRKTDPNVMIVFVTNLIEYAVEGYSVRAFDYIVKPVSYPIFSAKMDRIMRILTTRKTDISLKLKTKEGIVRIEADDILYLEVRNHAVYIHMGQGKSIRQWNSLANYEKILQKAYFARCNSCYLVNLKYVQGIQGDSVIVAGQMLTISIPRRKAFIEAFSQYTGGSRSQ